MGSEVAQALTKYQCTRPMVNMIHRAKSLEYNSDTESVSWVEGDSPVTVNISDIQEYKVDKENCCDKKLTTFDGEEYVFRLPEDFHSSADMNLSRTLAIQLCQRKLNLDPFVEYIVEQVQEHGRDEMRKLTRSSARSARLLGSQRREMQGEFGSLRDRHAPGKRCRLPGRPKMGPNRDVAYG